VAVTCWAVVTIAGLSIHTELKEQEAILDDLENRTDYAVHNMDDVNRLVMCPCFYYHMPARERKGERERERESFIRNFP